MRASLAQPALLRLAANAASMKPVQQAAYVQSAINQAVRSRADSKDCSDDGYWAPGGETLTRGMGDCFDLAIAKMEALRSLGFADRDFYLATGLFRGNGHDRGRGSAALLVHIDGEFWLLPEQTEQVIKADDSTQDVGFTPYITYGYGMTWVHGRRVRFVAGPALTGLHVVNRDLNLGAR